MKLRRPLRRSKLTEAKMATAKKAAKKSVAPKAPAKKGKTVDAKSAPAKGSMPAKGKDPKGGLTAAGRKYFREKEGSNLRPGVQGPADTPEKMLRKGSFLRRHYANPSGPVVDSKGQPTRQALQAAAWGEPVPKNEADEKKLAQKGAELLDRYHTAKGDRPKKSAKASAPSAGGEARKTPARPRSSGKKSSPK